MYVSRKPKKIVNAIENFEVIQYENLINLKDVDIIVNCTPCGMYPNIDKSPVGYNIISKFNVAIDMIYNPRDTLFLKYAKQLGLKTADGLYMLVTQAIASQEIWQQKKIPQQMVREIYEVVKRKIYTMS